MPQSSLNKQLSQQIRDINRGTRWLEARHKNQRTSSRRRGVQQKSFIVPKWHFFLYCCGHLKPIQSLWRQMQLLGESRINEPTCSSFTYCFSYQSRRFWSDKSENACFYSSVKILRGRWEYVTARAEELSNAGHNTVTADCSYTALTKAQQNDDNTNESQTNTV